MIKFFGKIRQKLIEKFKIQSYFVYAFGEIVLVVIGILIALQINNWNENRKQENDREKIINNEITKDNYAEYPFVKSLTSSYSPFEAQTKGFEMTKDLVVKTKFLKILKLKKIRLVY